MKRTLTVLAAAALLAGCSNGGTEAPATKTVTEAPETTVATTEATTEAASESTGEATNDAAYDEVKVAAEDKIVELLVDGNHVMEQESEQDAEDVAKAGQATVAIEDAIKDALSQHDGILDSAELDEDNGVLQWEVSIDNPDGTDLAEVNLPAK